MAKLKAKSDIKYIVATDVRNAIIDECAKCVPTNWCDSLLTGPTKVGNLPARETEELLRRIQDRIRALKLPNGERS
jgi:hypothetical protein